MSLSEYDPFSFLFVPRACSSLPKQSKDTTYAFTSFGEFKTNSGHARGAKTVTADQSQRTGPNSWVPTKAAPDVTSTNINVHSVQGSEDTMSTTNPILRTGRKW